MCPHLGDRPIFVKIEYANGIEKKMLKTP